MQFRILLITFIAFAFGCTTTPKNLTKAEAIKIAKEAIESREHWKNGGDFRAFDYKIGGHPSIWRVTGFEVVDPSIPNQETKNLQWTNAVRYSGGRWVTVTMDMTGKIIYYLPGVE